MVAPQAFCSRVFPEPQHRWATGTFFPAVICPEHPTIADLQEQRGGLDPGHGHLGSAANQPRDELGHDNTQAKL